MSDVKDLIDQYADENRDLKVQMEALFTILRDVVVLLGGTKGEIRIVQKNRDRADKYALEVKQLKTAIVLQVKEKTED